MKDLLIKVLMTLYAGVGIVAAIGYWPTIKDVFNKKPSANTHSYLIWTATSTITILYGIFILPDLLFLLVAGVNFVCCATIFVLSLNIKNKSQQRVRRK